MHVLSSSLFQNSVMILLIFKMQAMYSPNLSRIRNITSFPNRCALMPRGYPVNWLLLRQARLPLSSLSWPRVNPTPLLSSMWESTCSGQRGSDSAQWEVGGAARARALCPACSPSAHPHQTHPLWPPFPGRTPVWPAQARAQRPPAHSRPSVRSSAPMSFRRPESHTWRLRNQRCPSWSHCLKEVPIGLLCGLHGGRGQRVWRQKAPGQKDMFPSDSGRKGSKSVYPEVDPWAPWAPWGKRHKEGRPVPADGAQPAEGLTGSHSESSCASPATSSSLPRASGSS